MFCCFIFGKTGRQSFLVPVHSQMPAAARRGHIPAGSPELSPLSCVLPGTRVTKLSSASAQSWMRGGMPKV